MATILVADDSDLYRKIIRSFLEQGGYAVIEAVDGREAVELARREHPHLVMLDAEMPVMDGWEACRAITSSPSTAAIPVLMFTGHDLSVEPDKLAVVGARGCLAKPFKPAQLFEKIAEILHGENSHHGR